MVRRGHGKKLAEYPLTEASVTGQGNVKFSAERLCSLWHSKQGGTTDYLIDLPLHRKLFLCKGFLLYPAQTTNRSNTMKKQSITNHAGADGAGQTDCPPRHCREQTADTP